VYTLCYYTGSMTATMNSRLSAMALAAVIVVGSLVLWIGVPYGSFWLAARVTSDSVRGVLFALVAIPVAMAGGAWALYRVNSVYEGLRGEPARRASPPAWRQSLGERRDVRRANPPRLIDITMTGSAIAALVLLFVWFFFFADMRLAPMG
jgi:hypothetical protein